MKFGIDSSIQRVNPIAAKKSRIPGVPSYNNIVVMGKLSQVATCPMKSCCIHASDAITFLADEKRNASAAEFIVVPLYQQAGAV